jgi:hypothetical protein
VTESSRECSDHRKPISLSQSILCETSIGNIAHDQHTSASELHATHRTLTLKSRSIPPNSLNLSKKTIRQAPRSRKLITAKFWEQALDCHSDNAALRVPEHAVSRGVC